MTKIVEHWTRGLIGVVAALVGFGPAVAKAEDMPALRVVVLSTFSLEGSPGNAAPLDAAASRALREAGLRPIDLDASLRAQAFALAEAVDAGQIPEGITALNADAIWRIDFSCRTQTVETPHATVSTCDCFFTRRVTRDEDRIFEVSDPWRGRCAGAQIASLTLIRDMIPGQLSSDVEIWKENWRSDGTWDIDLMVTGFRDRSHYTALAGRLEALPGVTAVRMGTFSRTASRISLRGEGRAAAERLADHIEEDATLSLTIVHQTDRLIRAEFDFNQAHRRQARLLFVPPTGTRPKTQGALVAEAGPDLVRSALTNLGWLDVGEVVTGSAANNRARDQLVRAARQAQEPYVVAVAFRSTREGRGEEQWTVTTSLLGSRDGREIVSGTGQDSDPLTALDSAVRDLDTRFLAAISDAGRRTRLGLPEAAVADASAPSVRVDSFELQPMFPTRVREYRETGIGVIRLANDTKSPISEARLEVRAGGTLLAGIDLPEVAPESEAEFPVKIQSLPDLDPEATHRLQVEATISYRVGDSYGRVRAYRPLMVHRRNALDWSQARSVAAFIDPTDSVVRDLATRAMGSELPEAATRSMARAAMVYSSLWHQPLQYVADPVTTAFDESIDDVQHPRQTLARMAGDCDDLTVLLASLYESIGLATAIVTTPGHVLLAVESGLLSGGHLLMGQQASRFIEVDGALFIPVEATAIGVGFGEAWRLGAEIVSRAGDTAVSFRTRDAWRRYPTVSMATDAAPRMEIEAPDVSALAAVLPNLDIPSSSPGDAKIAAPVIAWLGGDREAGSIAAANDCAEGSSEACFNLAVMLVAEAGGADMEGEGDAPLPPLLVDALSLLPVHVVNMILDHGGLGMGDDQSEASGGATTRRQMEDVLRQAQERQAALRARGEGGRGVQIDPMGGRRGNPAAEPKELAPMFFFGPVEG